MVSLSFLKVMDCFSEMYLCMLLFLTKVSQNLSERGIFGAEKTKIMQKHN